MRDPKTKNRSSINIGNGIGISISIYTVIGVLVYWCIGVLVYWCIGTSIDIGNMGGLGGLGIARKVTGSNQVGDGREKYGEENTECEWVVSRMYI